jgi:prevent-host-death family protein
VPVIPQKERNNVAEVVRRAEGGEQITITVAGRPVAHLGPARRRQRVSGAEFRTFAHPPPAMLAVLERHGLRPTFVRHAIPWNLAGLER